VYDYQLKRGVAVGQATLEENDGQIELVVPRACLPENGGKIYLMRPKDTTNSDDLFPYDIFHSLRIDPMPHAITYWGRLVNGFSGICESDASKLPFVRDSRIERILINPCEAFTFG
jgi:hypothetical protein